MVVQDREEVYNKNMMKSVLSEIFEYIFSYFDLIIGSINLNQGQI